MQETEAPLWIHALLVGSGLFAGFVNTVAGAGSALTVPALVISGLDATAANASNRLAVVVQTFAGVASFHRREVRPWRDCLPAIPALAVGGVGGALLATVVSPGGLQLVFGVLFIVLAALLMLKPRWLTPPDASLGEAAAHPWSPATQVMLLATGAYGGFVQAGVGIPLLIVLVRRLGLTLVMGNAAKVALTGIFTFAALAVFQGAGQVDWVRGAEVAIGSFVGSLLGVEAAVRLGVTLIRRAVVVGLLLAAGKMLGVY